MDSLVQRYGQLRRELPASVQLLAVSKGQPADAVRLLYELGQRSFGESRLQEAQEKQALLADLVDIDWHFIGRLQTNKVRPVLARFSCLHSVDSLELAKRISRIALEEGRSPKLYAQVQLRLDPNKGGFQLEQLRHFDLSTAPVVVGLLALAGLALVLLLRRERVAPAPLLPIGLLSQPVIWRSNGMAACHGATLTALVAFLPIYLRVTHGL
ncbi:MAG: hypothetical protein EBR68_04965, partial [Synechococcaceae bacterium WB4_2_0811]|nr:hypothetical protein [Synechococcaceae bacterium WB4_2_0811]